MAAPLAFDDLYRREFPRIVNSLVLACGDPSAAQDAASEAFARALERWPRVSTMESPGGWIMVVAWNGLRRGLRKAALEQTTLSVLRAPTVDPPALADHDLWHAVAGLAPRARTAIALRYVGDLAEADVAKVMGITRGTVAATLHAARAQLATALDEENLDVRN